MNNSTERLKFIKHIILVSLTGLLFYYGMTWFCSVLWGLGLLGIYGQKMKMVPSLLVSFRYISLTSALVFTLVGILVSIPSESMRPTLTNGDYVWVSKLPMKQYERGDILVFEEAGETLIKRVVAVEGDRIEYRDHKLYVNGFSKQGAMLGEDRYSGPMRDRVNIIYQEGKYSISVAKVDDESSKTVNHAEIRDGRNKDQCEYGAEYIRCIVPKGHYFMMGDNRDNSIDSRYFGAVSKENIVGRAVMILFNLDNQERVWKTL